MEMPTQKLSMIIILDAPYHSMNSSSLTSTSLSSCFLPLQSMKAPQYSLVYCMHFYPSPLLRLLVLPEIVHPSIFQVFPTLQTGVWPCYLQEAPRDRANLRSDSGSSKLQTSLQQKLWDACSNCTFLQLTQYVPNQVSGWGLGIHRLNILGDSDIHIVSRKIFCFLSFVLQHGLFL